MRTLCCVVLTLLVSAPAAAAPFTWLVEGRITNLQNVGFGLPYDGAFAVGQPYAWSITMESSSPDFDAQPRCGQYAPITSMRFASGAISLAIDTRPGQEYLLNAGSGFCTPPFADYARVRSDFGTGLFLSMHYWSTFASDALPTIPNLTRPGTLDFILFSPSPSFGGIAIANATVTAITVVPEPGTTLLALGGAVAAWRLRRRRRTTPA